jgi:hypothetical protein
LERRIAFEGGQAAGDRAAEAFEVPEALALRGQLGLLGLAGSRPLDLLELPHQQVELAIARPRARLQLGQSRLGRARLGVRLRAGRAALRLLRPAEAVQDVELRRGERELAVLVLAVERQQRAADVAQVGRRGAAPAQIGARAPLGRHAPGEHELLRVRRQAVGQVRGQIRRQREHALDVGLRRPRAARCPAAACRPATGPRRGPSTVLPAPVSPVSAFSPAPRRSSARSISSRFSTRSSWSMGSTVYQPSGTDPGGVTVL